MRSTPGGRNTRASNAKIHKMMRFTSRHIAYAAVQVFHLVLFIYHLLMDFVKAIFLLGTSETWSANDEGFNLLEFFNPRRRAFSETRRSIH